jgi:hypothetical protein
VSVSDDEARRYLLGELSEADEAALEASVLADAEAFAALELAEDDLFEACARGELPAAAQTRFAARFLRTPEGQQRLAVVRGLVARAAGVEQAAPAVPWWRRPILQLAFAAAVLLLCAVGLWRLRSGDSGGEPQLAMITVELGSATRSEGEALVRLPPGAGDHVLVRLRPDVSAARLRLTLLGPGGTPVVPPVDARELLVDAAHLPDGRYELRAQSLGAGAAEDLAFYGFRVVRTR